MLLKPSQLRTISYHLRALAKVLESETREPAAPVRSHIAPEDPHISEFLQAHLIPAPGREVTTRELRAAYETWCQEHGIKAAHYRALFRQVPGPRRNANSQFRFVGWQLR